MVTTTRRPNVDTLARWDAALKRATDQGLRLFQHDATGQWFCSGSDGQTVYAVGHVTCECAAALANDPVCQHRALYREACRVDDEPVGMTDAELDALIASATIPYDAALIERMLDASEEGEPVTVDGVVVARITHDPAIGYSVKLVDVETVSQELYEELHQSDYTTRRKAVAAVRKAFRPSTAMLDGEALTFDEAAAMEGTTVLSVAAGSRSVATLPARKMCTDCLDTGTARMYTGGRGNEWVPVTCGCRRAVA